MSCDQIGEYVKPSFSAELKCDPYHIPGYQGFVPQMKYKSEGKTFSNATNKLFENPCVASSGKLILADIENQDGQPLIKPGFESKIWNQEMRRCKEIHDRCLPGCYAEKPAAFPQAYLQPSDANVHSHMFHQPAPQQQHHHQQQLQQQHLQQQHQHLHQQQQQQHHLHLQQHHQPMRNLPPHTYAQLDATAAPCVAASSLGSKTAGGNQKNNAFSEEFLVCPSQTIYDPRTDCRYFMFSQQNERDCGARELRPAAAGACVAIPSCKEICPCPQTQLKTRQLYPECGGMMSGYGGHVPGLFDCSIGDNYKKATAKVLKQMVGGTRECPGPWTLKLPDCNKKRDAGKSFGSAEKCKRVSLNCSPEKKWPCPIKG